MIYDQYKTPPIPKFDPGFIINHESRLFQRVILLWQGLILGLSNGAVCLVSCAPIILPYMLGSGKSIRNNFSDLCLFLIGRFSGYLCFGLLAWYARQLLFDNPVFRSRFIGVTAVALGVALIFYNLSRNKRQCELQRSAGLLKVGIFKKMQYYPWLFGLITGVNLCPPFLLVFTEAINSNNLTQSLLFFSAFAVGTSLFFIPFPFVGAFKNNHKLKILGELTFYLIAVYYIIKGLTYIS